MEQQTAVEWLENRVKNMVKYGGDLGDDYPALLKHIEQAKEKEKKQIVEAFYQGVDQESDTHGAMNLDRKYAENYYNETFKTN